MDWGRVAELGGTVVMAGLFLAYLRYQVNSFLRFLSNHMGKTTAAMDRICDRLERMQDAIRGCAHNK